MSTELSCLAVLQLKGYGYLEDRRPAANVSPPHLQSQVPHLYRLLNIDLNGLHTNAYMGLECPAFLCML